MKRLLGIAAVVLALVAALMGGAIIATQWIDHKGDEFVETRVQMPEKTALTSSGGPPRQPTPEQRASAYSAAASYLNLQYGFPMGVLAALLGALVTLIAAVVAGVLATRQGDVDILRFLEEKIRPAIEVQQLLLSTIGDLLAWTGEAQDIAYACAQRIANQGGHQSSPVFAAIAGISLIFRDARDRGLLQEDADIEAVARSLGTEIAKLSRKEDRDLVLALFQKTVRLLPKSTRFQAGMNALSSDIYASLFMRTRAADLCGEKNPLEWMAKQLPELAHKEAHLFNVTPVELADNLEILIGITLPIHLVQAAEHSPREASTDLEFLGRVVLDWTTSDMRPMDANDARTDKVHVNFGAAYLLLLFLLIPEPETLLSAFKNVFKDREPLARRFIEAVMPLPKYLAPRSVVQQMSILAADFSRLVRVGSSVEPYSPTVSVSAYNQRIHAALIRHIGSGWPGAQYKKSATPKGRAPNSKTLEALARALGS